MSIYPPIRLALWEDLLSQQQGSPAPVPAQFLSACLLIVRRQLTTFDLPPEAVDLILAAWRPSKQLIYACRWDKFVIWFGTQ